MNAIGSMPKSAAESAFLAELLAETLGLAGKIVGALEASRETPRNQAGLSPIRRAEIAADAKMRASVGAAMDREYARQMDEWRGLAAAKRTPLKKPASVANLKPAPFALTPAVVAKAIGLPKVGSAGAAKGLVDVPIAAVKLVDRPRRSEDPRLAKANDDSSPPAPSEPIPSEPRLGSRAPESLNGAGAQKITSSEPPLGGAPAAADEAQHCHSLTSADEHTAAAGAQEAAKPQRVAKPQYGSRERVIEQQRQADAEAAARAGARATARKFGGGVGAPLPVKPDAELVDIDFDRHERELRRIDTRPPIKISDHAERRAAELAREDAKAARIAQFKASWAKVRARAAEEAE